MRSISRRDFLVVSGVVAASSLLPGCGAGGVAGESSLEGESPRVVADLSRPHFESLVGTPFRFRSRGGQIGWLELEATVDQTEVAHYPDDVSFRDPFVLVFRGPEDTLPGEGTYTITHPEFDAFDLHVIPRMPEVEGARYDIIFS